MSNFLIGAAVGALIAWIIEYFLYRRYAEVQIGDLQHQLHAAQQQATHLKHDADGQSAEINALRNRLAEAHVESERSNSSMQAEIDRLNGELNAMQTQLSDCSNALDGEKRASAAAAAAASTQLEEYRTRLANAEAQVEMVQGIQPEPDDLKRIEGIGPKVESVLVGGGVATFVQLANSTPEELRQILKAGGMRRINDPETWPEQAALAVAGEWDALEKLQDELDGGRRRRR